MSAGVLLLLISTAKATSLGWINLSALGDYRTTQSFSLIETTLSGSRIQPHPTAETRTDRPRAGEDLAWPVILRGGLS